MKLLGIIAAALAAGAVQAQNIKIGELNSYKVFPAFLEPYKKGMELALEEINAAGGVNGRKLELVAATTAARRATRCAWPRSCCRARRSNVLMGTFASNVGLAVANLANQRKVLFLASEPLTDKIVWENGNRYTFRLRPSTYMQTAMLIPEAAKLEARSAGRSCIPTTNTASRRPRRSRSCSRRRSPASSSSPSRRRRSARSTPARWCRRSPTPSPTRSSARSSPPTCRSSCAREIRAACSRTGRCST